MTTATESSSSSDSWVDVSDDHIAGDTDLLAQPPADRAATASDLETAPALRRHAEISWPLEGDPVVSLFEAAEPLLCLTGRIAQDVGCHRSSFRRSTGRA